MKSKNMLATNPKLQERQEEDFYATHPHALEIFLDRLEKDNIQLNNNIWECACGAGHLSKVLEDKGYNVKKTDIIDRGCNAEIKDFLTCTKKYNGDILTNPPFKLAEQFLNKSIELLEDRNRLYLFLKVQFLEGKKRKALFEKYPPKYVYVNSERQHTARDGNFGKYSNSIATLCFCWFIWEKGFNGEPIIRWI